MSIAVTEHWIPTTGEIRSAYAAGFALDAEDRDDRERKFDLWLYDRDRRLRAQLTDGEIMKPSPGSDGSVIPDAATLATVRERLALAAELAGQAREMEERAMELLMSAAPSSALRARQADAALKWDAVMDRMEQLSVAVRETEGHAGEDAGRDV